MGVVIVPPFVKGTAAFPARPAPVPDILALTLEQPDPQGKTQDPRGKATVRKRSAAPSSTACAPRVTCAAARAGGARCWRMPEPGVRITGAPGRLSAGTLRDEGCLPWPR